jgi:KDO2-lipid IV(A) lauroyltransferase
MSDAERARIADGMWDNLGRVMVETMMLDRILAEADRRIEIADDFFRRRYAGKMGTTVLVTLHMGNWEIAIWPAMEAGLNPAGVYRLLKNPYVDQWVRDQRKELYPGGLFGRGRAHDNAEGQRTARLIMDYVRQGGRLGLISDLYDNQGIDVPFFGKPARTTPMPAMIVRRVGSRLWVGRCVRLGRASRFRIEVHEQKVPRTPNQVEDIRWVTEEIQKTFEAWVRENPEQWMWRNRRWS